MTLENLDTLVFEHNALTELPPEIAKLGELADLHLNYNGLSDLPETFGQLSELRDLQLAHNRFARFPAALDKLLTQHGLLGLDLSHNQLTEISPSVFAGCTQEIVLSHNQIETIPDEYLCLLDKDFCTLDLRGNPLRNFNVELARSRVKESLLIDEV